MAPGKLFIIGTPIGNLSDLSPRAAEALRACDRILCEDTRRTQKLLNHIALKKPLISFHDHNETERTPEVLEQLRAGATIGLVSDAGMPLISDPGFILVREVRKEGIAVEPIPGPFAGALALAVSGIAPHPFAFFGFSPHKQSQRLDFYRTIAEHSMTSIVYESPNRINESLTDALEILGDVEMTLAREMTKLHEEFIHGTIESVRKSIAERELAGEITLVFAASAPAVRDELNLVDIRKSFDALRESGMRRNDALKLIAEKYGLGKNALYKMLMDGGGGR